MRRTKHAPRKPPLHALKTWATGLFARVRPDAPGKPVAMAQGVGGAPSQPPAPDRARLLLAVAEYLRQPLYALSLTSESLLRHPQRPPGPSVLLQMKAALRSLDERLDALRLMAGLDSGSLRPEVKDFSLQPLLDRLDLAYGPLAASKGLRWDVTPSAARVRSNPVLLERMLGNLVGNAVRFTARGGVVVSCRFRGPHLLLQVWDTGGGIDPAHEPHVFDAFFRGVSEADGDTGAGLGLAIVKSAAVALGIDVGVRCAAGRGTCFSLRVPLTAGAARGPASLEG
ncbi:sensor histidine kinase [Hydrogenophaga sp.]|uniref:sensor histidine kinase n=1 Tax=Hydrogenophaga sp. TaxID=1904254 RepID=UPI003D1330F9